MTGTGIKNLILIVISTVGGFIAEFLGGVDSILKALVIFMIVDYITGLIVAFVFHKSRKTEGGGVSSKEGLKGIIKKICMLMLIGVAHALDNVMGADYLRATLIMFFMANEGISILENIGLMGVKYPAFLMKALETLRDNNDGEDDNTDE